MRVVAPLLLLFCASCASAPPPLWDETRTYEVELRPESGWKEARAAACSVISRLDLQETSVALLRAEKLESPHGDYRVECNTNSGSFIGYTIFGSSWTEGELEPRTLLLLLDGSAGAADRFRITVMLTWWHPRATREAAYPRALLDAIEKKLIQEVPAALEAKGLTGTVKRIVGP